jgi:hypothetical protein
MVDTTTDTAMKVGQQWWLIGGIVLVGLAGLMTFTNPGNRSYEQYASEQLSQYLKEEGCSQLAGKLGGIGTSYCKTLVETIQPQMKQAIAQETKRHNYLLFSIYKTELSLPSPAPTYYFETVGILHNFYTYQAEEL